MSPGLSLNSELQMILLLVSLLKGVNASQTGSFEKRVSVDREYTRLLSHLTSLLGYSSGYGSQ